VVVSHISRKTIDLYKKSGMWDTRGLVVGTDFKSDCRAAPIISAHVRQGEHGAPVRFPLTLVYRVLSRNTTRTIRTTNRNAFNTNSIGIICWSLL
jgi:hypothetical protein